MTSGWVLYVDGVHSETNEPIHPTLSIDRSVYSHKYNNAGVSYELGTCLYTSKIIWTNMQYNDTFTRRLRDLRAMVSRDKKRAVDDKAALMIALRNHPAPAVNHRGEPQWNGSKAQELLGVDIDNRVYPEKNTPRELWSSRAEYKQFDPDIFRWRIHQHIRTSKYIYTKNLEAEEKRKKAAGNTDKSND